MRGLKCCPAKYFAPLLLLCFLTLSCAPRPAVAAHAGNPGIVEVDGQELQRYRQVVALSDVHGHIQNTRLLLQKAAVLDSAGKWNAGNTLLIITGDSIDKGPGSIKVLHLWMELQTQAKAQDGRVIALLGNHEAEFLADPAGDTKTELLAQEATTEGVTLAQMAGEAKDKEGYALGPFLHQMPLAARVGNWLFCHAGWLPDPQTLAPDKTTPEVRWAELKRQAALQSYAALTDEEVMQGKPGPFYATLEKKYAGDLNSSAAKEAGESKWWENKPEVGRLLARLDQYGLTGVVFGHQPKAFGLTHSVGPYSAPDTKKQNYRLLKIDSGLGEDPADGLDADSKQTYYGHLLKFTEIKGFLTDPKKFQPEIPLLGLQMVGDADNSEK